MKAWKCDRCNALFDEMKGLEQEGEVYETAGPHATFFRVDFILTITNHGDRSNDEPDLCPSCRSDVLKAVASKLK